MGFLLAGNGLLVVFLTIMAYKKVSFACSASNSQCVFDIYTVNAATQFEQKRSGNAMNLSLYSGPLCGTAHLQFVLVVALLQLYSPCHQWASSTTKYLTTCLIRHISVM